MAVFIAERDLEKDFRINDGRIITIKLTDEWDEISFWNGKTELDGEFEFQECNNVYLLKRMYCPVKKNGLGREALKMFKEYTEGEIVTRPNDGQQRTDGSHLTEDAPVFVRAMQKEELIENWFLD